MSSKKLITTQTNQFRRRAHGSAWHWLQTDAWYFTPPGTKRRVALLDSSGKRIKGKSNKQAAELPLARFKSRAVWKPSPEEAMEPKPAVLVATYRKSLVKAHTGRWPSFLSPCRGGAWGG